MARNDPPRLKVWLGGIHVADLVAKRQWDLRCVYTEQALDTWPGNTPVISCSLPLSSRPRNANAFCEGLLPEGQHRQALAAALRIPVNYTFDLLKRYGRDIAGAVVIGTEAADDRRGEVELYTEETLAAEVANITDHPLGIRDDSELSVAGLQDKFTLVRTDQGWARPRHGRASTHILKVDDKRRTGIVAAEAQCLLLARAVGLTTIDVEIVHLAGVDCLVVSRFDRHVDADGTVHRTHQEDACQALDVNIHAERGRGKYEDAGGPSLRAIAALLDRHSADPPAQFDRLVAAVTFTLAIGNADAHGKNIALLHPAPGRVELAPLYDTVPTVLWPELRTAVAMSVNGRRQMAEITIDDIAAEARAWPHDPARARTTAIDTAEQLRDIVLSGDVISSESPVAAPTLQRLESLLANAKR